MTAGQFNSLKEGRASMLERLVAPRRNSPGRDMAFLLEGPDFRGQIVQGYQIGQQEVKESKTDLRQQSAASRRQSRAAAGKSSVASKPTVVEKI